MDLPDSPSDRMSLLLRYSSLMELFPIPEVDFKDLLYVVSNENELVPVRVILAGSLVCSIATFGGSWTSISYYYHAYVAKVTAEERSRRVWRYRGTAGRRTWKTVGEICDEYRERAFKRMRSVLAMSAGGDTCDCCDLASLELETPELRKCARCQMAYYCSKECSGRKATRLPAASQVEVKAGDLFLYLESENESSEDPKKILARAVEPVPDSTEWVVQGVDIEEYNRTIQVHELQRARPADVINDRLFVPEERLND